MAHRQITHVTKDYYGNITHVGVAYQWKESSPEAINNIRYGVHSYFVQSGGVATNVHVVNDNPPYLRTDPDRTVRNNLDNLATF